MLAQFRERVRLPRRTQEVVPLIRRLALLLSCVALAFTALFALAPSASAGADEPDIADFTDEEGNIDFEGYVAALNASTGQAGGLPETGSDSGELIALGAGLVLVGGSAVIWARDRQQRRTAA